MRELRRQFPLGERRPLLVTEVTRMSQAVCVACNDLHAGRIVRPLPRNITNWPNVEYTSGRIAVGTVLGVVPADPQPVSARYRRPDEEARLESLDRVAVEVTPVIDVHEDVGAALQLGIDSACRFELLLWTNPERWRV
jgi:hypothetical protein